MSPLNPLNQTNQISQSQVQPAILKKNQIKHICIPAGSCKFLVFTAKGVPHKGNFMMQGTQDGNLPSGINNTYVQPTKSG